MKNTTHWIHVIMGLISDPLEGGNGIHLMVFDPSKVRSSIVKCFDTFQPFQESVLSILYCSPSKCDKLMASHLFDSLEKFVRSISVDILQWEFAARKIVSMSWSTLIIDVKRRAKDWALAVRTEVEGFEGGATVLFWASWHSIVVRFWF